MNSEEKQILDFLQPCPNVFFSHREIGKKAGTRRQFDVDPDWARPHLKHLAAKGHLKTNPLGQFCFVPSEERKKKEYKIGGHFKPISAEEARKVLGTNNLPGANPASSGTGLGQK